VPGHAFDIVDDSGASVPAGTKGNLVLTEPFPTMCRTVWQDPDRYHSAYFERFPGRYATNDEALLDEDGHLWVLGRSDDVINVAAHRISTMEIEATIGAHHGVAEVAVVGVPDPVMGERVRAVAVLRAGQRLALGALREWAGTQLADYKLPAELVTVSELPRNPSGKVMKKQLAGQAGGT
ncbi:MAG: AMP-binding enzyme, partial [Streptosporangiaceae bacterium]